MTTIGFDLGAGTTRLALLDVSKPMPQVLRNNLSNEGTATVVSYPPDGARCFGESAVPKQFSLPKETVTDLSQWVFSPNPDVSKPREMGEGENAKRTHPAQVAAYFIRSILKFAPSGGHEAAHVCLAVPTLATSSSISVLKKACHIAGIRKETLYVARSDEASAVYFHHMNYASLSPDVPHTVALIDVGASRSSASVWSVSQTRIEKVSVKAVPIGSSIVDAAIASYAIEHMKPEHRSAIHGDVKSVARVLQACKKTKEILSSVEHTNLQVEGLKGDVDINVQVTRTLVESLAVPLTSALRTMLSELREELNLTDGLRVEAVGGGWRSIFVSEVIKSCLGVSRIGVCLDANLAIAEGCAIISAVRDKELGGADARNPVHNVELVNFEAFEQIVDAASDDDDGGSESDWLALEEQLAAADSVIHERVESINTLDTLTLQTLGIVDSLTLSDERRAKLRAYLLSQDDYLRDDCNGEPMKDILARVEEVRLELAEKYPEVEKYYSTQIEAQLKKDEELAKMSKLEDEDKELKSDPQRFRVAQQRREQGQKLFREELWAEAQTRFVQALAILGQLYDTTSDEAREKRDEITLSCYLNIASCSVKLGIWRNAINNCTKALEIKPDHPKALFRRGQALAATREYEDAIKDLERSNELSGGDAAVTAELQLAKKKFDEQRSKERQMFAKMFS